MNLDLREIPAVYINLEQDVERKNSIVDVLDECGFENIIRVDGEYTPERPLAVAHIHITKHLTKLHHLLLSLKMIVRQRTLERL